MCQSWPLLNQFYSGPIVQWPHLACVYLLAYIYVSRLYLLTKYVVARSVFYLYHMNWLLNFYFWIIGDDLYYVVLCELLSIIVLYYIQCCLAFHRRLVALANITLRQKFEKSWKWGKSKFCDISVKKVPNVILIHSIL